MALGGNPRLLSAFCHLGNLIPDITDRPAHRKDGAPILNSETKVQERTLIGAPRAYWPMREDTKLRLRDIYDDLQVNDVGEESWRWVRYPTEDGEAKAELQNQRIEWLMTGLKHTKKEATALAEREFYHFFDAEAVDEQDPLGSLTEVPSKTIISINNNNK